MVWIAELSFFWLTIYRGINSDLLQCAAGFNEIPRWIQRIFPWKTDVFLAVTVQHYPVSRRSALCQLTGFCHWTALLTLVTRQWLSALFVLDIAQNTRCVTLHRRTFKRQLTSTNFRLEQICFSSKSVKNVVVSLDEVNCNERRAFHKQHKMWIRCMSITSITAVTQDTT